MKNVKVMGQFCIFTKLFCYNVLAISFQFSTNKQYPNTPFHKLFPWQLFFFWLTGLKINRTKQAILQTDHRGQCRGYKPKVRLTINI